MALKAHLDALSSRHKVLDTSLNDELKNLSRDEYRINELKRQKLRLKDEINKLRRRTN